MRSKDPELPVKQRIINAAIALFLEKGFALTTLRMISAASGVGNGSLTNCFPTKEHMLLVLVERMADHQLENVEALFSDAPPLYRYCAEIAVELTLCEHDERARELYVAAYSLPRTLEYIKQFSYKKSRALLGDRLPGWTEQDFYEVEVATTGILFGFLVERCNARFTVEQKIARALDNLLKLYDVEPQERDEAIRQALALDLAGYAEKMMAQVVEKERARSEEFLKNGG